MLYKKIFETIITGLKTNVTELKKVSRYKGEFESNSEYDPKPPEVFISFNGDKPETLAGGKRGNIVISISLFVVASGVKEAKVLEIVEAVEEYLDGLKFTVTVIIGEEETVLKNLVTLGSTSLLGYLKGGEEVYKIDALIT